MQRIDRNTMEAGVESIFKMLAQRVDDNQMQLVRNAYELAAEHTRSRSARRVNLISFIRLLWHVLWPRNWNLEPIP